MAAGNDGFWSVDAKHTDPVLTGFEKEVFSIEIMHIASGKACVLPAWLTSYNENFTSTWNSQQVFGRSDPIGAWNGTSRRISIGLGIPSFTPEEAYANMHQFEHLIAFLYPSYQSEGSVKTMNAYPLLKIKFANLIKNANIEQNAVSVLKGGLSGWIENVDYTPNLEAGFHHMRPGMSDSVVKAYNKIRDNGTRKTTNRSHTFIPKVFELNFSFVVVHEHSLGWSGTRWLGGVGHGFPYGYESQGGKTHDVNRGSTAVNNSPMNRIRGDDGRQVVQASTSRGSKARRKASKNTQKNKSATKSASNKATGKK